jgi:hypothetical protein
MPIDKSMLLTGTSIPPKKRRKTLHFAIRTSLVAAQPAEICRFRLKRDAEAAGPALSDEGRTPGVETVGAC